MATISLTIKSNFADASKDIKAIGDLTEREAARIAKFQNSFKSDQIDTFIQRNERAAAAVRATQGPIEALEAKHAGLRREIERLIRNGMDPQDEKLKELQREYADTSRQVDAHTRKTKANEDALRMNEQAARAAGLALVAMAAAAGAAAVAGSKAWIDYSKNIANVNTMIDMTADDFEFLDSKITKLSNSLAIQKSELSGGVYQALSAGAADLNEALEIVEASATLGKGALINNAAAVDIVTTAMNAYGKETVNASRAIDTYFTIIKQGKINGEQLSQTIGHSITLFSSAKIPIEQLGAGIATLTKVGVNAAEATTQLNGIVNAFLKPSEAMRKELEKIGYASGAAFLEAEGLTGVIKFLDTASEGSIDTLAEMIPNIRGLQGALAAAAQDGQTYNDVLAAFNDQSGAAEDALRKQTDGFADDAFSIDKAKIAIQNLGIELGQKLLPVIGKIASGVSDFLTDAGRMDSFLRNILPIIAGVAAGLASFLIITKVIAIIRGLGGALAALNAILAASPVMLIAVAIAVVVLAVIWLIKNWDVAVVYIQTTVAKLEERFKVFGSVLNTAWTVAVSKLKIAFLGLGFIIIDKVLGSIQKLLDLAAKLPGGVGQMFENLSNDVSGFRGSLQAAKDEAVAQSEAVIAGARAETEAARAAAESNISQINREKRARLDALKAQEEENARVQAEIAAGPTAPPSSGPAAGGGEAVALQIKLGALQNMEAQANIERIATYDEFLAARMEQEHIFGNGRLEFLQSEQARILSLETLTGAERVAAEQAIAQQLITVESQTADARRAIREAELTSVADFFGSLSALAEAAAGKSRGMAILMKGLSMAQAGINSFLAFTQVLADPSFIGRPFMRAIAAGAVLASGLAQQINIGKTPIPSAETGGRFTVPGSSSTSRGDSTIMRVNPGETVDVSPRGGSTGRSLTVNAIIDRRVLWSVTQEGIDAGEITVSNDNIRSA